jgi:hypothetical protein
MGLAGAINLTMLVVAAALFHESGNVGVDSIEGAHAGFERLIGGGAALAAVGVVIGLFGGFLNPIDLILLLLLIGIAATVFLSANVPAIPHLRLITFAVVLIGFGMALDRLGFGTAGAGELLLFIGTAAAAIGAIILELGRDQPLGGPQP